MRALPHWIVIPVKAPADCKTRLSAVLDDAERQRLVADMLANVVAACSGIAGAEVMLLGPHRHGLSEAIRLLPDIGGGLNAALAAAVRVARMAGVGRLSFVSGDLPLATGEAIERLVSSDSDAIRIAPDRAGIGTNALSLPLPAATAFRFHYGTGSFAAHVREAARLGLPIESIRAPGLAYDVDLPEDLPVTASRSA